MTATIHGKKQLNPELTTFVSSSYCMNIRMWTSKNSFYAVKNMNTWLAESGGCWGRHVDIKSIPFLPNTIYTYMYVVLKLAQQMFVFFLVQKYNSRLIFVYLKQTGFCSHAILLSFHFGLWTFSLSRLLIVSNSTTVSLIQCNFSNFDSMYLKFSDKYQCWEKPELTKTLRIIQIFQRNERKNPSYSKLRPETDTFNN